MGFKFENITCVIEIEGRKYPVAFTKSLIDEIEKSKGIFGKIKADTADIDTVTSTFDTAIDSILGSGSAAVIFEGRFKNVIERFAVLKYIYDELTAFMNSVAVNGGANVLSQK